MNHLGFQNGGKLPHETVIFFLFNGLGTIVYTLIAKSGATKVVPGWVGTIAVNAFVFGLSPFFTAPFLRAGFFEGE